jgi:hypothetical protein
MPGYQSRWWYVERPFPWPLVVVPVLVVAVLVWVLW